MPKRRKGTFPRFDVGDPRARRTLWARHQLLRIRYQKLDLLVYVIKEFIEIMTKYESQLEEDAIQLHADADDLLEYEFRRKSIAAE